MDRLLQDALAELTKACTQRIDKLEIRMNRPPFVGGDLGGQGNLAAQRKALGC
jgi:hypothetical protein